MLNIYQKLCQDILFEVMIETPLEQRENVIEKDLDSLIFIFQRWAQRSII